MALPESVTKKITLLTIIQQRKDILFGTSGTVTKSSKEKAWREVLISAQTLQLASPEHTWHYARDNLFGLWKSRTLAKTVGRAKHTKKLDRIDEMILNILDKEARPQQSGSVAADVFKQDEDDDDDEEDEQEQEQEQEPEEEEEEEIEIPSEIIPPEEASKAIKRKRIELLNIEIYYRRLKILKMERDLELPPSKYTRTIIHSFED